MLGRSKKNDALSSYFSSSVTLEGRLCFSGAIRLDGRVHGEIISSGTLIVEETSVITGDILVENIILSGTVYGNIHASKQVQLNATAKVYGHIAYGELSIEGAIHEGSSHKLTPEEITVVQRECASIMEEAIANAEKATPDQEALDQYVARIGSGEKRARISPEKKPEALPETTSEQPKKAASDKKEKDGAGKKGETSAEAGDSLAGEA